MEDSAENKTNLTESERIHLKEERKIRNKQKREKKRIEKQQNNKRREELFKVRPQGSNVSIITKDFANRLFPSQPPRANSCLLRNEDFPALGSKSKLSTNEQQSADSTTDKHELHVEKKSKKKDSGIKIDLFELISSEQCVVHIKNKCEDSPSLSTPYKGNALDSSLPKRMEGKHRENVNKKTSKFKKAVSYDVEIFEKMHINVDGYFDTENEQSSCYSYCDNTINKELNDSVAEFLQKVVNLQEKMYKKNPRNGKIKKRYVVGFKEVQKYTVLNKMKLIVIAIDLNTANMDGALSNTINNIRHLAFSKSISYVFALNRRQLGRISLKYLPISCIGVINYSSLEENFGKLLEDISIAKKEFQETCTNTEKNEVDQISLPILENLKIALQEK